MAFSSRVLALVAIVSGVGLTACTAKEAPASRDSVASAIPGSDTTKAGGMAGMSGMSAGQVMLGNAMMDSTRTEMRAMGSTSADQMAAMLPTYSQRVTNMLSQMTSDMRTMNMTADAMWTSLADSVRQDLIRLPAMTKPELKQAIPAHHARVTRLMQMHTDMLAKRSK